MPKDISKQQQQLRTQIQGLQGTAEEVKREKKRLLAQNRDLVFSRDKDAIEESFKAQKNELDRLFAVLYHSTKLSLCKGVGQKSLTLDQQLRMGAAYDLSDAPEFAMHEQKERELRTELLGDATRTLPNGAVALEPEKVRKYYELLTISECKLELDLMQERDRLLQTTLAGEPDGVRKAYLADNLVFSSENLPIKLSDELNSFNLAVMQESLNGRSYRDLMHNAICSDFLSRLVPREAPTMRVGEFLELLPVSEERKQQFLAAYACKPEDNLIGMLEADRDKKLPGAKREDLQGQALADRQAEVHEAAMDMITTNIVPILASARIEQWKNEDRARFRSGLQPSERKRLESGRKIRLYGTIDHELSAEEKAIKKELNKDRALNEKLKTKADALKKENESAFFDEVHQVCTGGKALNLRASYGVSEYYYDPQKREHYDRRSWVAQGALQTMRATETRFAFHRSNSAKFENMVRSIDEYQRALSAGEGGRAIDLRQTMIASCLNYVKGKESLRNEINGQTRFDAAMTVLSAELKKEEFQTLLNRVNKSRDKQHKVDAEYYARKRSEAMNKAWNQSREAQKSSHRNATELKDARLGRMNALQERYGVQNEKLPAVGVRPTAERAKLSPKDFTALSFICSKLSPKRTIKEANALEQNDNAVEDGKDAAQRMLREYARGNKLPLATAIVMGREILSKLELGEKTLPVEKSCIREMSMRLQGMAERDPELMKHVNRLSPTVAAELEKEKLRTERMSSLRAALNEPQQGKKNFVDTFQPAPLKRTDMIRREQSYPLGQRYGFYSEADFRGLTILTADEASARAEIQRRDKHFEEKEANQMRKKNLPQEKLLEANPDRQAAGKVYKFRKFDQNAVKLNGQALTNAQFSAVALAACFQAKHMKAACAADRSYYDPMLEKALINMNFTEEEAAQITYSQSRTMGTTDLFINPPRDNEGTFIEPYINPARLEAADAFESYQKGNPEPLAKLIAHGVNVFPMDFNQGGLKIGAQMRGTIMMGQELVGMLEQDPALAKKAAACGMEPDKLAALRGMIKVQELEQQARAAEYKLLKATAEGKQLSREEKKECASQLLCAKLALHQLNGHFENLVSDPNSRLMQFATTVKQQPAPKTGNLDIYNHQLKGERTVPPAVGSVYLDSFNQAMEGIKMVCPISKLLSSLSTQEGERMLRNRAAEIVQKQHLEALGEEELCNVVSMEFGSLDVRPEVAKLNAALEPANANLQVNEAQNAQQGVQNRQDIGNLQLA